MSIGRPIYRRLLRASGSACPWWSPPQSAPAAKSAGPDCRRAFERGFSGPAGGWRGCAAASSRAGRAAVGGPAATASSSHITTAVCGWWCLSVQSSRAWAWLVASKFLGVFISTVCTWNSFLKFRAILGKEGSLLILKQFSSYYIFHGLKI